MIVYRCVSDRELASMIGLPTYINAPHGNNTFKYEEETSYKHFFYYYDSVISFMDSQNRDRYHDKYSIIMAYNIDNEILNKYLGLGEYNLACTPNNLKDSLLKYFKTIYYPEFAVLESLITTDMIVGIGTKASITPLKRENYDLVNDAIRNSEKAFLEYIKWLFNNGTDVKIDKLLENKDLLFPINNEEKIKNLNLNQG